MLEIECLLIFYLSIMGITQTKGLPSGIEQQSTINHQRFATRQILRSKEGEQTIAITVAVPSEKQYKAWADDLSKVTNQQPLMLPISHSFERSGFCGSAGVAKLIFENYPFILSDQIHNRECLNARFFEENQLWYLALTLLTAAQEFHARGRKVGDIRPMNVFISQDGTVKLACSSSWPLERSNYEKSFQKQVTYLSPEEVIDLAYAKTQPSADFQLAQTFSIGLTLLDAATLGDSTELYKNSKQIDYQRLEERLAELASRPYSNPLVQVITNMCEAAPQSRTSAKELLDWLSPYEEAINNFTTFAPETLPAKFNRSGILPNNSEYNPSYNPKPYASAYNPISAGVPPVVYYTSSSGKPQDTSNSIPTIPPSGSFVPNLPPQPYFPALAGVTESTYVPFSSKFSLSKIDEQLEQSRRNFPS